MNADIQTGAGAGTGPRDPATNVEVNLEALSRNWGWIALRGFAAVLFGILTLFVPLASLAALVLLFGAFALVDGISNIIAVFRKRSGRPWWALLLQGLVSMGAGLITLFVPGLTAIALLYVIAAWAFVSGIFSVVAAIRLRKEIKGEGWLIASGVLSVAIGIILALFPGAGALALVLWIGAYSVIFGTLLLALAFKLRGMWHREERSHPAHPRVAPAP